MSPTLHGHQETDSLLQLVSTRQSWFGVALHLVYLSYLLFIPFADAFRSERLRKLDLHQGFVKGVCWDPVGEFLATQSDDRSVKIWKTSDWSIEAEVKKPFEDSPGSTFFRRLRCDFFFYLRLAFYMKFILRSWSPDGAHITASNATNNKGYVFIAAVITRNTWTSEISLVGHENTVEVAVSLPCLYHRYMRHSLSHQQVLQPPYFPPKSRITYFYLEHLLCCRIRSR